jgi:hypothetical protein
MELRRRLVDQAWDRWHSLDHEQQVEGYFSVLLILILTPSVTAYFWGPGWGVGVGAVATVIYFFIGGDSGLGELRWFTWLGGMNLLLFQLLILMHLINQVLRAGLR